MPALNLCLHYVSEGAPARRMTVSREALRALVLEQLEAGRRCASLAEYTSGAPEAGAFTLSFDDAHRSVLEHARPVLAELGVTATLFVPTGYVGTSVELLDWDDVRAMRDAGWTIGSHSVSHPRMSWRLYDEGEGSHAARLAEECSRSREALRRELGEASALFAYPYGEAPPLAREAARAAGYAAAFTVAGEDAAHDDPFAIPRVDPTTPPALWDEPTRFAVIVPACDRPAIVRDVVSRLAAQSYPEERYEVVVVDDGSEPPLEGVLTPPLPGVRVVRQGDGVFRAGQARQRGVDETEATHLVFLDADVAVEPDFLWHLDWVHRREPDVALLGYLSGYNLHDLGHLHTPERVIGQDLATLPRIPDRSREPTLRACLDNLDWLAEPWPLTYTGNLSLPRALLERAGGFAHDFEGWGLEDVDLGVRLARAGARFVFSRFALGVHMVDPSEPASRNPFRDPAPSRARFDGYLENLARLERRHVGDAAVAAYCARSRADIEETCGAPGTVGVEMGGAARVRPPHHRRLHQVQPGGLGRHELLDRLAYAEKVGARALYLLGGAPAEHPSFLEVVARGAKLGWVSAQTLVYPFADEARLSEALEAGLRGAVLLVHTFDEEQYEALHGPGTYAAFDAGLARLLASPLTCDAHLVVTAETAPALEATLAGLTARGLRVVECSVVERSVVEGGADEGLEARVRRSLPRDVELTRR